MRAAIAQRTGIFSVSALLVLALGTVMFARVFTAMGAPKITDFAHFVLFAGLAVVMFLTPPNQVSGRLGLGSGLLFLTICASAILNGDGVVNVVLEFVLLVEPFLLLLVITRSDWTPRSIERFRFWLLAFAVTHMVFAYFQFAFLGQVGDEVKGLFLQQRAGHHVGGALALTAAAYFFVESPVRFLWNRAVIAVAFAGVAIISDSKQMIAVFVLSLFIIWLPKLGSIRTIGKYLFYSAMLLALVWWVTDAFLPQLQVWNRIGWMRVGIEQKLTVFGIIISFYDSGLNWLFGLGPGHTVGRVGLLLPKYGDVLFPLGATTSPVTETVFLAHQGHWISNTATGSSVWSLFFTWAGVWGDLGLAGLAAYLSLWWFVWRRICVDALAKFLLLTVFILGGLFTWMEEPAYVLFVVSLLGLRYQERRSGYTRGAMGLTRQAQGSS